MKKVIIICLAAAVVLAAGSAVQAKSIKDDPLYKASTNLSIGPWTTVQPGDPDYELSGYGISEEFQLNLLYQPGILDEDIDDLNHYWQAIPGWTYNYGDHEEYVLNISATGGLTIYEYDDLRETVGGPEIKWTITGWHQTILAGDIIDNGDGTITLVVLPEKTYRPFVGDPPVNDVEVFDGDLDCEVLGYTFTGAIGDIGNGSVLNVNLFSITVCPESATLIFEGVLSDAGGGVYTGTIPMTAGEFYVAGGPGENTYTGGGFDVYGKQGGQAYVQGYYGTGAFNGPLGNDSYIIGYYADSPHDAYPSPGGPWGSWYNPDCADWDKYSLELTANHWYLRYTLTGESMMSGAMDWSNLFAAESDLGTQNGGHSGSAAYGGGAGAWDWDCGWGVEVIPLEQPGFSVTVTDLGGGQYKVTLVPGSPSEVWVDNDFDSSTPGWGVTHFDKIQDGIDAVTGSTVHVAAGVYDETLNIDGVTGLDIIGEDKDTTIIKSSTTIGLNVGGYGTTRQTVVRIVNSSDILIEGLTIDCDLIKGSNRYAVFGWDSELTLNDDILKNASVDDLSGGYADITTYFRATGFSAASRAQVNITNSTFIDPGRVAILVHDYVNVNVSGNTFYKTFADFGYAMEIGSQSTGSVTGNTIYGYDTPAASDGSSSAGIYIENCFTGVLFGGCPHVDKAVTVHGNEVYDCQYAMHIGNEWNGYAGDVDIQIDLQGNNFHNNVSGGIIVADEDKEAGSSVTISNTGNTIADNNEFGYFVYTFGDGDITVDLSGDTMTGHQYGMYVGDYPSGPSGSSFNVAINCTDLSNNSVYGIDNEVASVTVDAVKNWWGDASGPSGAGAGSGSAVSANVDFFPWLLSTDCGDYAQIVPDYVVDDDWAGLPDWTTVTFGSQNYYIGINAFDTIQEAINAASDGNNISVAAGTYNEAVLINKSLNIRGATCDLNKNGYEVPADYAWDDLVESIINHPNPTAAYNAVVDIYDVNDVTFEGFVVQELNAVGNLNTSLVRVYAYSHEISNIIVRNNVIGANTNLAAQDGKQGRMGLYIINHPYSDKGVVNSTFAGNKIFDCKGNGDNIFIWSSYFAYGAPGEASMRGTVIEDNEIYGSHRSGIETAGGFADLTIKNNRIYGNSGLPSDDPNHLKYGAGILLVRGSSDKTGGPTTAYGPVNLKIKGNEIFDNEKNGIYTDPILTDVSITGNDIYDNGWDAVRIDLEGTYWNPTFEPEPGAWSCYDGASDIEVSFNNLYNNGAGVEVIGTPTNGLVVDGTYNWWGNPSGPDDPTGTIETDDIVCYDVSVMKNADGLGDAVSEYVNYCTWLSAPLTTPGSGCPAGDLDFDCDVDFADLAIFAGNWLAGTED